MSHCVECGKEVIPLDVALTKKLTGRAAERYFCKACLAKKFEVTEKTLDEMAERFRKEGCMLFC